MNLYFTQLLQVLHLSLLRYVDLKGNKLQIFFGSNVKWCFYIFRCSLGINLMYLPPHLQNTVQ